MATREGDNDERRLTFGRFVLDLRSGVLLLDGREVVLAPKSFEVMSYLAQHPDRVVSRDELLAAIWPNLVITDDALLQSIDDLRRALGEPGQRMIVPVAQGYRFVPGEAPPDRRKSREWHPLRWRWVYGILAPLALLLTFVVLWLGMRSCAS
jgi:DNA-binding winged helix-turn-helix (wHTH) protein